jgi:hypothetical protein
MIQISLAASIPILAVLLILELSIHRTRASSHMQNARSVDGWHHDTGDLHAWRRDLARRHVEVAGLSASGSKRKRRRRTDKAKDQDMVNRIIDHAKTAWPLWWGSSEHAKSPFDFVAPPLVGQKRRVLFLTGAS